MADTLPSALERLAAAARGRRGPPGLPPLRRLVACYYRHVAPDVAAELDPARALAVALAHLEFARERRRGVARVRVENPPAEARLLERPQTVIEVVIDDMPFLVDSLRMALNRHGHVVNLLVHPVLRVARDAAGRLEAVEAEDGSGRPESFIHVEIDRVLPAERLLELQRELNAVLRDVRRAVRDWQPMRQRLAESVRALEEAVVPLPVKAVEEARAFLEWLDQKNFTFLGYQRLERVPRSRPARLAPVAGSALGLLRGAGRGLPETVVESDHPALLLVTKSTRRSTVHRPAYLDDIAVRHYDRRGRLVGESRFLGLYTSLAYRRHPADIPLLREKIDTVVARAGFDPASHLGKAFLHILETYPRDELFQIDIDALYENALAILHLADRQRLKLFVRPDPLGRYVVCLVYVPRDRYDSALRRRVASRLQQAFGAVDLEFNVALTEDHFARIEFFLPLDGGGPPAVDVAALEAELEDLSRAWVDRLRDHLLRRFGEADCARLWARYGAAFPAAYQLETGVEQAACDIRMFESLDEARPLRLRLGRDGDVLHLRVYSRGAPLAPSDALPVLERCGLRVLEERPFRIEAETVGPLWLHDYRLDPRGLDVERVLANEAPLAEVFEAVMAGRAENDDFNALAPALGVPARAIVVLRAYARHLLQTGFAYSVPYMAQVLLRYPDIGLGLIELFRLRFDPDIDPADRPAALEAAETALREALAEQVGGLDEDRILRAFFTLLRATVRTNHYREDGSPALALKLQPERIPGLPEPRPAHEVFVYSPRVEGVHLRAGRVARGGLRWSDRREDFRTEVLQLVKAQKVKNAIIVPTGAKGGFVVKRPPPAGDRDAWYAAGVACYREFIGALLDVTDNRVGERIEPPPRVVRHDGDDAYLVVAADKGTASFSDIANEIALARGFWLGDAFASGGSNGYDHKKMGITARGAWECVRLHFYKLGRDIQREPFTVVGIGDMSGDVFGNGMLLSPYIKLVAAFNHQHIFIDPDPDPEVAYRERKRLFGLPRSSWADYDPACLSRGGGVWSRQAKAIKLSPEARALLGAERSSLSPDELIRLILRAEVDLLWNGGIGTYVKSRDERHGDVGDRANDAVRIDADELRCKVVGEGGNLGLTQRARIDYALRGGRVDADFIHNAGGVNCSDHEVNIKILLDAAVRAGRLDEAGRRALLAEMEPAVAELVLQANYWQTVAIDLMEAEAPALLDEHARFIGHLEAAGVLRRELEALPDAETLLERKAAGRGLVRPELGVLLAYAKISAKAALAEADLLDDAFFGGELARYFPARLVEICGDLIPAHPLRREILATFIANRMLNRMGASWLLRMEEETGADVLRITRAYSVAWAVYRLRELWQALAALDGRGDQATKLRMMQEVVHLTERGAKRVLRRGLDRGPVGATVERYRPAADLLLELLPRLLAESDREAVHRQAEDWRAGGADERLAWTVVALDALYCVFDVADLSERHGVDVETAARTYFAVSGRLSIWWLRRQLGAFRAADHWADLARRNLLDELDEGLARRTAEVLAAGRGGPEAVDAWCAGRRVALARYERLVQALRAAERPGLAMYTVVLRALDALGDGAA